MNVRVWKANASEQLGTLLPREKHRQAYNRALVERHKHLPEVKRIVRHRHLPAAIYKASRAFLCCLFWCSIVLRVRPGVPSPQGARGGGPAGWRAGWVAGEGPCPALRCAAWLSPPRRSPPQAGKVRRTMIDSERRKTQNRIAHSAPGSVKVKPERKRKIVEELE
jgi:hypothetical protein